MSESQNYEEVTVASEGITVIKTFEAEAFPVPAIAFRIRSNRTESVTVRIVDTVPEDVAVEDLGFHPEYGSEHWTIEDDEITFEREIGSEEEYTTVYGIRATGSDDIEKFLTEPEIADVDPPLEEGDVIGDSNGSDVVRDVISGDADAVPGLDDEDEDIGTLDLADPNAEGEEEGPPVEAEAETETETETEPADDADTDGAAADQATNGTVEIENIAATLADEIREDEVDDEDLELLREELDIEPAGSVEARIEKLQTDVSELDAYTDALEEFLDENGTGQELIEDVQDDISEFRDELESIEGAVSDQNEQVNSLEESVSGLSDDVQTLKGDVKAVTDDIEAIDETVEDLESQLGDIDDVDDEIEEIEDSIEELQEWREQLSNVLGAADGN